jgi:hypothetical protein
LESAGIAGEARLRFSFPQGQEEAHGRPLAPGRPFAALLEEFGMGLGKQATEGLGRPSGIPVVSLGFKHLKLDDRSHHWIFIWK